MREVVRERLSQRKARQFVHVKVRGPGAPRDGLDIMLTVFDERPRRDTYDEPWTLAVIRALELQGSHVATKLSGLRRESLGSAPRGGRSLPAISAA